MVVMVEVDGVVTGNYEGSHSCDGDSGTSNHSDGSCKENDNHVGSGDGWSGSGGDRGIYDLIHQISQQVPINNQDI